MQIFSDIFIYIASILILGCYFFIFGRVFLQALEKIKKDRNYDKMKQKKEKNIKEEAIQIKKEKETNEKENQ